MEWGTTSLGDVAEFVRGINFKPNDVVPVGASGSVACMRTKNVQSELDCSDVWGVGERFVRREDQFLKTGDILVSSANSWNLVGKCCWIPDLPWRATFGGFVSVLRPKQTRVEPRFLFRWFSSDRIQTTLRSFGQQTTNISNLNTDRCLKLQLPLPPLPEQRRIAEILDRAEALRAKRRGTLAQLDALRQAVFLDVFGQLRPENKHVAKSLADCAEVVSGIAKGRKLNGREKVLAPYLRVANVQAGYLDLSEIKTIEALPSEVAELCLMPGDLVLTEGGDFDKLGRGAMWEGQIARCIHQNHVFRVWVDGSLLLPVFLHEYLQMSAARAYFLRCAKRTTNLASINMTQLRALPVLLPPLALQRDFASRIVAVEKLKTKHRASLAEMDALFASLQYLAFRGEL